MSHYVAHKSAGVKPIVVIHREGVTGGLAHFTAG